MTRGSQRESLVRRAGAGLAVLLVAGLVVGVGYATVNFQQLRDELPRMGAEPQRAASIGRAADDAIDFAQESALPPESDGSGKGYAFNSPAPSGQEPGHWCSAAPIDYRIDFTGARQAGLTVTGERARWRETFRKWARASGDAYRFRYSGRATYRIDPDSDHGLPLTDSDGDRGTIAITYGVEPGRLSGRWTGYAEPELSTSLGLAGVKPVVWSGTEAGRITSALVIIDAADAAVDLHAVPTPYLHEVGHALGLSHVTDPGQLMYAHARGRYQPASGDRAGIRRLAAAGC